MEFYATAAQVIPTLLITMALTGGILARTPTPSADPAEHPRFVTHYLAFSAIYVTGGMVSGELAALLVLATGRPTATATAMTWVGLVAGLVGVVVPVVRAHWRRLHARSPQLIVAAATATAVLLTLLAIALEMARSR